MKRTINSSPDYKQAEQFILAVLRDQLPITLFYHGFQHTKDVMEAALRIAAAEQLSGEEVGMLRVAVAFHDCGFIDTYLNHEERGCELAKKHLPQFGFDKTQIDAICNMIMATKIPQTPSSRLEKILCDADLDYLGRDDAVIISRKLHQELNMHGKPMSDLQWNKAQLSFLKSHHYFTDFALQQRNAKKLEYLKSLEDKKF